MTRSNFSVEESQRSDDFASPHREKDGQVEVIPFRNISNVGPAGSINSSIENMVRWVQLQLSDGQPLIAPATLQELHSVQMAVPPQSMKGFCGFGYGLGWFMGLHKGNYLVAHGGGIDGFVSHVVLFPEEKMGIVVLTNSDRSFLFPNAASLAIADLLLDKEEDDWLLKFEEKDQEMKEQGKKAEQAPEAIEAITTRPSSIMSVPLNIPAME